MRAVVLAAGRGTRLAPLTDSIPKILVPIAGRPLLEHQLEYLAANGVDEVAVNVSHLADDVAAFLEGSPRVVPVRVSRESEPLGTAGALLPLRDFLTEPFLVLYGDVVTNMPLRELAAQHRRRGGAGTLAYYVSEETAGKGLLELDDEERILGFSEKGEAEGLGRINAGIYVLEPRILDLIEAGFSDFGYDVFPAALAAGLPLFGHRVSGYVHDVGSPALLKRVEREVASGSIAW